MFRNWSNYKSSQYLWYTDKWNPEQNYKWRGIDCCCVHISTMTLALLNYSSDLQAILYIRSLPQMEKQDFQTVFPDANPMGEFEKKNSNRMRLQLFVSSNRFDGKNARSWLWQANKCSTNIVTPLLGGSMVQNVLRIIVFKQNISFSMQTPLTSQQHLSTTRPLKTMTLQLMFGKVSFKIFSTAFNSQFVFRKSLEHNKSF